MDYLIGIIAALVGAFLYQRNKANTAEALNDNIKVKSDLNVIDQSVAKNTGLEQAEEAKQTELKKEIENVKVNETDLSTLASVIDAITKKRS